MNPTDPIFNGQEFAEFPRNEQGAVKIDELSAEQKALFWEMRAKQQTTGHNKFKEEADKKLADLQKELEAAKNKPQDNKQNLTEAELRDLVPGYGELTSREKQLLKDTIDPIVKNQTAMAQQVAKILDKERFTNEIDALVEKDEYKVIAKHLAAFKKFAYQDENLNVPLDVLADSFIVRNKLNAVEQPEPNRLGLEGGNNGGGGPIKKDGYTAEEIKQIRTSDPKRYIELIRTGKLKQKSS